jgi:tetratricopeptide (TPR) repeat protein
MSDIMNEQTIQHLLTEIDALEKQGKYKKGALLAEEVILQAKNNQDDKARAQALRLQGWMIMMMNDMNPLAALPIFQQAEELFTNIGMKEQVNRVLGHIGVAYYRANDYKQSEKYLQQALKQDEEQDNQQGIAVQLGNLGLLYSATGEIEEALECLNKALAINKKLKNFRCAASQLTGLASIYIFQQPNFREGLRCLREAFKHYEELDDLRSAANTIGFLADLYMKLGENTKAIQWYYRQLEFYDTSEFSLERAYAYNSLGVAFTRIDDFPQALVNFESSLEFFASAGQPLQHLITLNNKASCLRDLEQYEEAYGAFQEGLYLIEEHQLHGDEEFVLQGELGILLTKKECSEYNPSRAQYFLRVAIERLQGDDNKQYRSRFCIVKV